MTSLSTKPFSYILSFDDKVNENTPQILTQGEVEIIKSIAFDEGHRTGKEEAEQTIDHDLHRMVHLLTSHVEHLIQERQELCHELAQESVKLMTTVVDKVAPFFIEKSFLAELNACISKCIESHPQGLAIHVAPSIGGKLKKLIQEKNPSLLEKIKIHDLKEEQAEYTFKIDWERGYLTKNSVNLLEQIQQKMGEYDG